MAQEKDYTSLPEKGDKPLLKWLTGNVLPVLAVGVVTYGVARWSYAIAFPYLKGKVMGMKSAPIEPVADDKSESDEA